MGTRLVNESIRSLGEGFESFGNARRAAQARQDRLDAAEERKKAEQRRMDVVNSLNDERNALFEEISSNPDVTREDILPRLAPFQQAATQFSDPAMLSVTTDSVDAIFKAREEADKLRVKQEIEKDKIAAQREKLADKKKPKSTRERLSKLSGESRKRLESGQLALSGLDDMEKALEDGVQIVSGSTFNRNLPDNEFTEARSRFVEGFSRMQSGAALTAAEVARFESMAPKFSDSPKIRQRKLDNMRKELQRRVTSTGFTLDELKQIDEENFGPKETPPVVGSRDEDAIPRPGESAGTIKIISEEDFDANFKALRAANPQVDQRIQEINQRRAAKGQPPMAQSEIDQMLVKLLEKNGVRIE